MHRPPHRPTLARSLAVAGLCVTWLGLGCPARRGPPEPGTGLEAPTPQVPEGCEQPLTGLYRHAEDARYEYRARDDGRRLTLEVGVRGEDGGVRAPGADGVTLALERGPGGFSGVTRAQVRTPKGVLCTVEFPTRVQACGPEGLTLETAPSVAVDEQCQPPSTPDPSPFTAHTLVREGGPPPPQAPDAG